MTIDELQAKLDELRAEAESLPGAIRAAISANADGKKIAALVARREVLPVILAETEASLLDAQSAEIEKTLPALRATAAILRGRAIEAAAEVSRAKHAHNMAGRDSNGAKYRLDKALAEVKAARERAESLRGKAELAFSGAVIPR